MLKILNPYLKRVMRGRQGLVDFWNKTLKFDGLKIWYFQMKADILSLLFFPLAWLGAGIQAVSCAEFETWQSSYRAFVVPVLANLQGQLILTWKRTASVASCPLGQTNSFQSAFWRPFSWLFFHRTSWQMILEYKWISICTTICVWWGPHVHWNFFMSLQLKRAEKALQ